MKDSQAVVSKMGITLLDEFIGDLEQLIEKYQRRKQNVQKYRDWWQSKQDETRQT